MRFCDFARTDKVSIVSQQLVITNGNQLRSHTQKLVYVYSETTCSLSRGTGAVQVETSEKVSIRDYVHYIPPGNKNMMSGSW